MLLIVPDSGAGGNMRNFAVFYRGLPVMAMFL